MSPNKREREYARRRHEKWMERQREAQANRRRTWIAGLSAVVVLALAGGIVALSQSSRSSADAVTPSASATPGDTGSTTPATPATAATPPPPELAEGRAWTGQLTTNGGAITVELDGAAAPQAVASFVSLAQSGFFDDTSCHRLVTAGIYVLQCGDPTGTGTGGPSYRFGPIENAPTDNLYPAGTLAMARVGNDPNSQGSQFFIVYQDSTIPADDAGGYTVLGHVTSGLDLVDTVAKSGVTGGGTDGTPALALTIEGVTVQ